MKQDKKLILGMALLFLITFVSFGTIVVTEKLAPFFTDKIKTKFETYIEKNYKDDKNNLTIGKITYKNQQYKAKISNKKNKNWYFYITYQNKKIKDTYKEDYLEGKTLLTSIERKIEKKVKDELNQKLTITFPLTLNKYTNQIKENLISNNLKEIKTYDITLTITTPTLTTENINKELEKRIQELYQIDIYPNHYTIKINSKDEKLTITNLTEKTMKKEYRTQIINDIINNTNSNIIKENNITYNYVYK